MSPNFEGFSAGTPGPALLSVLLEGFFGISTHNAVVEFQKKYGLNSLNSIASIGEDNFTSELITEEEVNKLRPVDQSKQFTVPGEAIVVVHNKDAEPEYNVTVRAFGKDLQQEEEELQNFEWYF
jgi:hypothetical protein